MVLRDTYPRISGRDELEGAVGEEGVDGGGGRDPAKQGEREAAGCTECEHDGLFGGLPLGEGFALGMP